MKNARILIAYILLTLVSSYAWAEKYEFVRLTDGKSVELNAGDAAMVVAYDPDSGWDYLVATDGDVKTLYFTHQALEKRMIIVGPATLKADIQKPTRTATLNRSSENEMLSAKSLRY